MSNNEIEEKAIEWILKRDREGVSEEDRAALEAWLAKDARHRKAYLALDQFWDLTAGAKQWQPRDGRVDLDVLLPLATRKPSRTLHTLPLAAVLAVLASGLGWFVWNHFGEDRYSTPVGGYERVALEDGSVLQLNTDTQVRAQFDEHRRSVRLLRGEAYFDVAQDPRRPFEVRVGHTVARAVGTAFSVRVGANEQLELMVTQGRVLLLRDGATESSSLIEAGQRASSKSKQVAVAKVESQEIRRQLAWQAGQLAFDRQPLSRIVSEFNRYNHRTVRIASAELESLQLTGIFKATDLESFVAAVRSAAEVDVEEMDDTLVIRSR